MRRFPVTGSSRNIATAPPAAAPSRERFRRVFIRAPVFRKESLLVFLQNYHQARGWAFCLLDFRQLLTIGSALAGRLENSTLYRPKSSPVFGLGSTSTRHRSRARRS